MPSITALHLVELMPPNEVSMSPPNLVSSILLSRKRLVKLTVGGSTVVFQLTPSPRFDLETTVGVKDSVWLYLMTVVLDTE